MSFTRLQTKEHLEGMLHSTSLNKVTNLSSLLERAGRNLISKIDPEETIRIAQITNKVHDDIFDYSCPSDLKGRKVLDIRPQINRNEGDSFQQLHSKEFDMFKDSDTFEIRWNNGVKSLRLSKDVTPSPTTLHEMDSITSNGTWAVNGKASNLTLDTNNYVSGSGCLNFDLDSAGSSTSGGILVTDMTDPDYEPIMKIASGVITDKGGRTSHSAIVSRELGIPAIIGTLTATRKLKTGQNVTIDCSQGSIGYVYSGILKYKIEKIKYINSKLQIEIRVLGE